VISSTLISAFALAGCYLLHLLKSFLIFHSLSHYEDMMKASQQAQQQMQGMTEAEKRQAMENLEKMNQENK
jgi:uncharacterized membrane protein (DUF106 family)